MTTANKKKSQSILWIRRLLALQLVWLGVVGCGGGMDQNDMRAYAMQRTPDPEDEPSPAVAPVPAAEGTPPPPSPPAAGTPTPPAAAAASIPAVPVDSAGASMSVAPSATPEPKRPTTPEERARRAVESLEKIAAALEMYREQKGMYPPVAIRDRSRAPLLSWRVELLPYLGYNDLYQQFDQKQPWYAPKNKALLENIPWEYKSPEREDVKTNFVVPYGSSTIFQTVRTLHESRVEDGLNNTVLLLEADDQLAVHWTEPKEYQFDAQNPRHGLGSLRGGQVFLAWGGGTVGSVSMESPDKAFKAIFTADGGEPFTMASLNRPIDFAAVLASAPTAPLSPLNLPESTAGARPGVPVTRAPRRNTVASSSLASTYLSAASAALSQGDATSAWQWYYAALVTGGAPPKFAWYPAVKRPAFGLHFAVGVDTDVQARVRDVRRRDGAKATRGDLVRATEPYGEALLSVVEKHAVKVAIAKQLGFGEESASRRNGFDKAAAITVLLPGNEAQLRAEAMEVGCDVLVVLAVETNSRNTSRAVRLKLYDLGNRRELFTSHRLVYTPLQADRGEPGDKGGLQQVQWDLEDLLEDGLSPKTWPVTLNNRIAQKRVASLSESRDPYPPRVIAEIMDYRHQQLVDDAEVHNALENLLGDEAGTDLLLGNQSKRRRVLREWLPSADAEELIALAERKRRDKADD